VTAGGAPVTAEWALWGKETHDVGYHLLDCSNGTVSRENFDQVLTRYSPGRLESLPQVTVSWFVDSKSRTDYLAIAIHGAVSPDGASAELGSDQAIVLTSYFCVPFGQVAEGAVSYSAMYEGFRAVRLPVGSRRLITADLPAGGPGGSAGPASGLALRVAALLLTGQPVCILRAERVALRERLRFLDMVASLLPYGLRSRLSASTWASSTYQAHRLRLFFASAPRKRGDHVLAWDEADVSAIGDSYADDYLTWLQGMDAEQRVTRLAADTEPRNFTRSDVLRLLERLDIYDRKTPADPPRSPLRSRLLARPARGAAAAIESALRSCAQQLAAGETDPAGLAELRQHLGEDATAGERQSRQDIIRQHGLLRDDLQADPVARVQLYAVLLPLAFGTPLTYQGYCEAEECAGGRPGQLPSVPLLVAMDSTRLEPGVMPSFVRLLRLAASGDMTLGPSSPGRLLAPDHLVQLAVERSLRRHHARIVWDALRDRSDYLDRRMMQQALLQRGYYARELEGWYPGEPEYQVTVLSAVLRLAYGPVLGGSAAQEILTHSGSPPTTAVLGALQINMDPADTNRARLKRVLMRNAGLRARSD
jgi:hypothetical protein